MTDRSGVQPAVRNVLPKGVMCSGGCQRDAFWDVDGAKWCRECASRRFMGPATDKEEKE